MKKNSKKLAGVALGAALAFTFMGCPGGVEEHKHTYSEEWSSNDTHHWHAATCVHTEEVTDKAEHIYEDWTSRVAAPTYDTIEKKCKVCGYFAGSVEIRDDGRGHKFIIEYDENGNKVKRTHYYPDGLVNCVYVYDNNGKSVEFTKYNADGLMCIHYKVADGHYFDVKANSDGGAYFEEYDCNGNSVRGTYYLPDGLVSYVAEYDSNRSIVKCVKYNIDGSVSAEYQAADGHYFDVNTNSDGGVYIEEYDEEDYLIGYRSFNPDGTVDIEFVVEEGSYIRIYESNDGSLEFEAVDKGF